MGSGVRRHADQAGLRRFLTALERRVRRPVRFYLVGGCVMIDLGLRAATLDINYVADAADPQALGELEAVIRVLKNELDINVEPAGPADFLPIPRGALEWSRYVDRFGSVSVYYYDLASQVIAKAARGLQQDLSDAEQLVQTGQVSWNAVADRWSQVRASPTGWLHYEPEEVQARLDLLRSRLHPEGT